MSGASHDICSYFLAFGFVVEPLTLLDADRNESNYGNCCIEGYIKTSDNLQMRYYIESLKNVSVFLNVNNLFDVVTASLSYP